MTRDAAVTRARIALAALGLCLSTLPAATRPAPVDGFWGVGVGLFPREAARRGYDFPPDLRELPSLGASHVLLPVAWEQPRIDSSAVGPGRGTVDDELLLEVVRRARRAGLGVALMPFVEIAAPGPRDWRGRLRPEDPDAWWESYGWFIRHYAELAARARIDLLAIGSELTSLSTAEHGPRWRRLADEVRAIYAGPLAFVANHDALDLTAPFEVVDLVGVSAYFKLTSDPDAHETVLRRAWRRHAARLASLARSTRKRVVIFELGYPSIDGGAIRPWDYGRGAPIDLEEQRAAYGAAVDALGDAPWLAGTFFWMWFGPGGPHDRFYTPRGKPAEAEMRSFLQARTARLAIGDHIR